MISDRVAFHRQTVKTIGNLMIQAGFRQQSTKSFTLAINPDINGLVSLTVITEPGEEGIHIGPFLGVRHEKLERMVSELTGVEFSLEATATLHTALGYVTPSASYHEFPFSRTTAELVSREMVQMIVQYGVPWMRTYDSLEKITKALIEKYRDAARTRIPVVYYLKGNCDRAKMALEREVLALRNEEGAIPDQYRQFAAKLLARCQHDFPQTITGDT